MAKTIDKIAKAGHNTVDPTDAIKKLHADLIPLEATVQAAKAEVRKVRQEFKSQHDITLADFDAARRLALMDDDEERTMKVDNFRQCYNALVSGQQLDWLDAMDAPKIKAVK